MQKMIFLKLKEKSFDLIKFTDGLSAMVAAAGAIEQKSAELGIEIDLDADINPEVAEHADLVIERTQASVE